VTSVSPEPPRETAPGRSSATTELAGIDHRTASPSALSAADARKGYDGFRTYRPPPAIVVATEVQRITDAPRPRILVYASVERYSSSSSYSHASALPEANASASARRT
jgi:hypothetical protein